MLVADPVITLDCGSDALSLVTREVNGVASLSIPVRYHGQQRSFIVWVSAREQQRYPPPPMPTGYNVLVYPFCYVLVLSVSFLGGVTVLLCWVCCSTAATNRCCSERMKSVSARWMITAAPFQRCAEL